MTAAANYPHVEQHRLAVIGDRQDGKTYLAQLFAVTEAFKGQRVLFDCYNAEYASHTMRNCVELADIFHFPVKTVRMTNGKLAMEFFSGGHIWFEPVNRLNGRGYSPEIHIIDDVHGESHWNAKRVLRTVLR